MIGDLFEYLAYALAFMAVLCIFIAAVSATATYAVNKIATVKLQAEFARWYYRKRKKAQK